MGLLDKLGSGFRRQKTTPPEDQPKEESRGEQETIMTAAQKPAEKEKMEKRRALGRGLESLLPGPRVVAGTTTRQAGAAGGAATAQAVAEEPAAELSSARQPGAAVTSVAAVIPTAVVEKIEAVAEVATAELRSTTPSPRPGPIHTPTSTPSTASLAHAPGPTLSTTGSAEGSASTQPTTATTAITAEKPAAAPFMGAIGERPRSIHTSSGSGDGITMMAQAESRARVNLVVQLALSDIDKNPFQTRHVHKDDALEELAESIKVNGVVQPIVVRPSADEGRYVLILGERRLHASKLAGKETIPAIVRRVSEQQAAEMTIVENLQREDLSPLEQAEAFRVLSQEFKLTQQQIGQRVGLARESVSNYMRLLKLPREVMQLLAEKKIKFAEAKELLKLEDDDQISKAALYAVKKGMTLDQIERMVMSMNGLLDPFPGMPGEVKKKEGTARWVDPNVRAAQTDLERLLGVRVRIRDRKGKGKIVIEYATVSDYERVVGMLRARK